MGILLVSKGDVFILEGTEGDPRALFITRGKGEHPREIKPEVFVKHGTMRCGLVTPLIFARLMGGTIEEVEEILRSWQAGEWTDEHLAKVTVDEPPPKAITWRRP
jgi:hypothetical protein